MALIKKALMFAITSGLAKKAWDAYRQKSPARGDRGRAKLHETSRSLKQGDRERPRS